MQDFNKDWQNSDWFKELHEAMKDMEFEPDVDKQIHRYNNGLKTGAINKENGFIYGIRTDEGSKKGGITSFEEKRGAFARSKEKWTKDSINAGKKGGPIGGKKRIENLKKNENFIEYQTRIGKIGAQKSAEKTSVPILAFNYITGDFVGEYKSMADADKQLNIRYQNISGCINGRQKHAKKHSFIKKDDFIKLFILFFD